MPDSQLLPERVTMPLLTLITQQALDEDYQHVADRRAGQPAPTAGTGRRLTVIVVALFGVLVAVAGVQTARNAGVTSAGRDQIIDRINARRDTQAALEQQVADLRASNAAGESSYHDLGDELDAARATRNRLMRVTGFAALVGAGLRVVVDDAPSGDPDAVVRDDDLALLVNGLLEAGARGVAVNGQRWTALSALRNSGAVIRINDVSLSPPYTVEAVGDLRNLQANLVDSTSGSRFLDLAADLGMPVTREEVDSIQLPAAPARMLAVHDAQELTGKQPRQPDD
ncbi:DUF881 domain-containing protein [Nocardioides sp.]|uniref:DUF881 domain-containing protein n=1 Tax=Nocardioides sp. TaxID=35761 RepID=UPI0039E2E672